MNYPILEPASVRITLMILEWFIAVLFLQFALIFLIKTLKYTKTHDTTQERAFLGISFAFFANWLFTIGAEFHMEQEIWRMFFLYLGYIIPLVLLIRPYYLIERLIQVGKKLTLFVVLIGIICISLVLAFIDLQIALEFSDIGFYAMLFTFFFLYTIYSFSELKLVRNDRIYTRAVHSFTTGIIFIMASLLLTTEIMVDTYGLNIRIVGDLVHISGQLILSISFITIPHLSEYNWRLKLNEIFIMLKSGIGIYHKSFKDDKSSLHSKQLIVGGFKSVEVILDEITKSPGCSVIESKGIYIINEPGEYITGAIISQENLTSLRNILRKIIEKIETIYSDQLEKLRYGNKLLNEPIENIINEFLTKKL